MFDQNAFRALLLDVVREVIREELGARPASGDDYLSVARAAEVADVTAGTIRTWMCEGRLARFRAGRELRVRRADLERLLRGEAPGTEPSPEEAADVYFKRTRRGRLKLAP